MIRAAGILACTAGLLWAGPAPAYWTAGGFGTGMAVSGTLPAGFQPTATAAVQTVTVSWTQSTFQGSLLGTYSGGGYVVTRYPAAGGAGVTPDTACSATIAGSTAALFCQEAGVPIGSWKYTVTPVLNTWTGDPSSLSATVITTVAAPTLTSATSQNPAAGATTGDVQLAWSAVSGASGYNVYRRTSSGSYDYTAPLNGATPVTATTYTDPGTGLSGGASYAYVVRAVQASPAAESPSSNENATTTYTRPAAPSGTVTATPQAAARIAVGWTAVAGVTGYNVYRRTSVGAYDYSAPLNGATPISTTSFTDATAMNGVTYRYVVRAVSTGAGGAQIESVSSAESAAATADSVAPPLPTSITVGAGAGPLLISPTCTYAASTRFVNNAGKSAVPLTIQILPPEAGQTVVLSATTPGSTPVSAVVAATSTTVTTTVNLSALLDGTITLTARTSDVAGNTSAAVSPTTATVQDTAAALSGLTYTDNSTIMADSISGTSECGARITAVQTAGSAVGSTYPTLGTFTVASSGTFTNFNVAATSNIAYAYNVTATDLAANATTVAISGVAGP